MKVPGWISALVLGVMGWGIWNAVHDPRLGSRAVGNPRAREAVGAVQAWEETAFPGERVELSDFAFETGAPGADYAAEATVERAGKSARYVFRISEGKVVSARLK